MAKPDQSFTKSAAVYDHIYEHVVDYDHEAEVIGQLVQSRNPSASRLIEFASGTGQFLERLSRTYDVVGSDLSEEMVVVSRTKLPDVDVRVGDLGTMQWGAQFDVAICLFSAIGYVEDLERAIRNMAGHLTPGGLLIVDGWLHPEAAIDGFLSIACYEGSDMVVARSSRSKIVDRLTIMDMAHLVTDRTGSTWFEERHEMWLRDDGEYVAAMEQTGLQDIEVIESPWPNRSRFVGKISDE